MEASQGKTPLHKEGENRENTPPIRQDMRPHNEYKGALPPTKQTSKVTPVCNRKLDFTTVTDEPSTIRRSAKSQEMI